MKKVVAVQLPAPYCGIGCSFCRTANEHGGDVSAVRRALSEQLADCEEVYLTSVGETGNCAEFQDIVQMLQERGIPVSVLCATAQSVVAGLKRVEISYEEDEPTAFTAPLAIAKARKLGVPVVLSVVDKGNKAINPQALTERFNVSGVLIRALQAEGHSRSCHGHSSFWVSDSAELGAFPVGAYRELASIGVSAVCIDHLGRQVQYLGAAA
ncbi:MAG: hypothetical protein HYW51_00835 [Candidatus Doudnabacteria bacterium]|nr:hypothetical protein [Candidatus Doudnabacteria bacterium]